MPGGNSGRRSVFSTQAALTTALEVRMAEADLTAARVRELLHYDPETGLFTWLKTSGGGVLPGAHAGRSSGNRYATIRIDGAARRAHNVAWLWMTESLPTHYVDHINGIRGDNRWCNLREVTAHENAQNTAPRKRTHSGLRGVYPQHDKWIGRIGLNGQRHYLGIYDTREEAHAAYLAARAKMFVKQPIPREYMSLDMPPPLPPKAVGALPSPIIEVGQRWKTASGRKLRTFEVVELDEYGLKVRLRSEQSGVRCWASVSRFDRLGGYRLIAKPAGELEFESWIRTLKAPTPSMDTLEGKS